MSVTPTLEKPPDIVVGEIWNIDTGECLVCHSCRKDKVRSQFAKFLDEFCDLDLNEKRTCAQCHEQQGIWWYIDVSPDDTKGVN